jgi:branched-chain amino acid transport system permease protein
MKILLGNRQRLIIGAIALFCLLLPLIDRNDAHLNFVTDAAVYLLLALGLNIVVGYAGLLDLGYAAFFAIGSYTYAFLASPQFGLHWSFWVILPVSALVTALFGIILGAPTLRLRGDYLAIVTLGFGEIVPQTFLNLTQYTNGPNGINSLDAPSIFGHSFGFSSAPYYETALVAVLLVLWISTNLRSSRLGRAWMALREDELAAGYMGINLTRTKLSAFAVGASLAGVAGVIYAAKLSLVSPNQFQFSVSIFVLSMLVLGGMGSLTGVITGALVLATLNNALLPQATNIAASLGVHIDFTNIRVLIYGIILIAMMLFRPEGLIPNRTRKAEFREALTDPTIAGAEHALGPQVQ